MTPLADDIWIASGPVVAAALGFHYPTTMALIRRRDGSLWVWSPVGLSPKVRAAVDVLGPVADLIAPNALHHLALPEWQAAYPQARVHAAPGVAAKQPGLRIDHGLDGPSPWPGIDRVLIPNAIAPEVAFFHKASGTVLVCDLIQHLPMDWFSGWRKVVARLDLMTAHRPEVPRKFRLALRARDAGPALDTLLSWPAQRLVIAHGPPAPGKALARAFHWRRPT